MDRRLPEESKQKLLQDFQTLHQTPEGQQLLMLFKVRKLVPFIPDYMKEDGGALCRALQAEEHDRWKAMRNQQ